MKTCPRCGSEFADDLRFCPVDGTALRISSTLEIVPGAIIGERYEISEELGRGGMGVVYLATDIRLDRLCALKVLRTDALADADAVARFHREATNASRIIHPHVVAVYNFDETEDRLTYLAMEYVEGRSLAALLDDVGALSPRPAARIVWQIANALGAAHELKIVHRDLKPGNIMLTRYREWDDFVKVVDFGIAKAFGTTSGTGITSRGKWVGTPAYMSPEQWTAVDVDHRSDLYSLGLIAVSMLAGGLPPVERPGPLPSGRRLLDALPPNDWPDDLRQILIRCLAREPGDRFDSASDFATAFVGAISEWVPPEPGVREPWEARVPTGATPTAATLRFTPPPDSAPPVATTPSRRSRRLRYLIAALAVPSLVVGGISVLQSRNPDSDPASAPARAPDSTVAEPETSADSGAPQPRVAGQQPGRVESGGPPPQLPPATGDESPIAVEAALERLQALVDLSEPDADSANQAVILATALLEQTLPDTTRIEVAYRLAEANFLLGDESAACETLRGILPATRTTGYFNRSVLALIQRECQEQ